MASIKSSVSIRGLEQLRAALRGLPASVQKRTLAGAVREAGKVVLKKARELVPVDTGLLKRMLRVTRGKVRDSSAVAYVTVRRLTLKKIREYKKLTGKSSSANRNDPYYWQVLEFGKLPRTKHPFIKPAFDAEKENAAKRLKDALRDGVEKEAKKLAWGGNPK